jgi:two-component system, NarL family, response regulator DevR
MFMEWWEPAAVRADGVTDRVVVCGDAEGAVMLCALLGDAGFNVAFVDTETGALADAVEERPALVVVDIDGLDSMGFVVCNMLREKHGELLPIVLVSGDRTHTSDRVAALLLGADDYVVKPFEPTELVARMRRLLKRSTAAVGGTSVDTAQIAGFHLTPREDEVLSLLVQGLTQHEIAGELFISTNTVAAHIQRILHKLGVRNRAQAVAKAVRAGWLANPAVESPVGFRSMNRALDDAAHAATRRAPM